ncbi:MAG: hypothetical protein AAGC95_12295 [Pseudomonadota bacterium]
MKISVLALAGLFLTQAAAADGFDRDAFETFVSARAGDGAPVYWYSRGTVRAYPSGDLLYEMEGYDTARSHRPDPAKPLVHQYSRKTYIYRDPDTGAVITEANGQPVEPIAYPYQFITYELEGDNVVTFVEQGSGDDVVRIGPGDSMAAQRLGDALVVTAPLYLDFPIPGTGARYQAFENYDFFIQTAEGVAEPHQLSWVRYGDLSPALGGGAAIMHLITWRIEAYEDIPAPMRDWVEDAAPLWRAPPENLDDIRRLQGATQH